MKILFVMSQYRVCERILPVVPKLKNDYELDCLLVYQMSSKHVWPGDKDLRDNFFKEYGDYFNKRYTSENELIMMAAVNHSKAHSNSENVAVLVEHGFGVSFRNEKGMCPIYVCVYVDV